MIEAIILLVGLSFSTVVIEILNTIWAKLQHSIDESLPQSSVLKVMMFAVGIPLGAAWVLGIIYSVWLVSEYDWVS